MAHAHATESVKSKAGVLNVAEFWRVPWKFAVHVIVGTFIFATIATPAVALDWSVHRLGTYEISPVVIFGLQAAALVLFGTDLVLFVVLLLRTAIRMIKEL
jgi:hypothetical protein